MAMHGRGNCNCNCNCNGCGANCICNYPHVEICNGCGGGVDGDVAEHSEPHRACSLSNSAAALGDGPGFTRELQVVLPALFASDLPAPICFYLLFIRHRLISCAIVKCHRKRRVVVETCPAMPLNLHVLASAQLVYLPHLFFVATISQSMFFDTPLTVAISSNMRSAA